MKTAKEWLGIHGDGEPRYVLLLDKLDIEAIQADAREQGRREGLEEAYAILDGYFHSGHDCPYCHSVYERLKQTFIAELNISEQERSEPTATADVQEKP